MPDNDQMRHVRRAGTVSLFVFPLVLSAPALAAAATGAHTPAGLLPPVPLPVVSVLPSPLASTLSGLLGPAGPDPSASPSASSTPNPVGQLLAGVIGVLTTPATGAPQPTGGGVPGVLALPGSASLPGRAALPGAASPPATAPARAATPLRSQSVAGLTRTTARSTAGAAAHLAADPTPAGPSVVSLVTREPAAAPVVAGRRPVVAAVVEPAAAVVVPQAVAAHAARVAAEQKRTTDQVSTGLAALAFGCVSLAAAGQLAARRRTRA